MSFCVECGGPNPADAKFCGHCGAKLVMSAFLPSPVPPHPAEFVAEVEGFQSDLRAALEIFKNPVQPRTDKYPDPTIVIIGDLEDIAIRFSVLNSQIPPAKAELYQQIFSPFDANLRTYNYLDIVSRMQVRSIVMPENPPGAIHKPFELSIFELMDKSNGTDYATRFGLLMLQLADLVCRCDGQIDESERLALNQLRTLVARVDSVS